MSKEIVLLILQIVFGGTAAGSWAMTYFLIRFYKRDDKDSTAVGLFIIALFSLGIISAAIWIFAWLQSLT